MKRLSGILAAILWILFGITGVIRWMAGDGELLAAEMLQEAPPEKTGLPEAEYPGVCRMTADYLTGGTADFQYTVPDGTGGETECFQEHEAAHMADCRELIRLDTWVCIGCLAAAVLLTVYGIIRPEGRKRFLRGILWGLRIAGAVAGGMLIWAIADFDGLFVTFHHVAFRNDGWLLDPRTDLLIRLMPENFFVRLGIRGALRALAVPVVLYTAARIAGTRESLFTEGKT